MPLKNQWAQNILVIAPHADDEVIGCGGIMSLAAESGSNVSIVIMGVGGINHRHNSESLFDDYRKIESEVSTLKLGIQNCKILYEGKEIRLETIPMLDIVTALDSVLDETQFDEVYIPQPSHNLDHRITYEAAITALRPGCRNPAPSLVATYEGTTSNWRPQELSSGLLYVDISNVIEKKLAAYEEFKSQLRPYPHPMSSAAVKNLASMRGMECCVPFAEMFRIIRQLR